MMAAQSSDWTIHFQLLTTEQNLKKKLHMRQGLTVFYVFQVDRSTKMAALASDWPRYLFVYYTIPFGFSLFRHFLDNAFHFLKLICLPKDH